MKDWQSQAHVKWECKYHVVIIPKYRRKEFYGRFRRLVGAILRELCRQKDLELLEGKEDRLCVVRADEELFGLPLGQDVIVQLDQVDALQPETLQAAFD